MSICLRAVKVAVVAVVTVVDAAAVAASNKIRQQPARKGALTTMIQEAAFLPHHQHVFS